MAHQDLRLGRMQGYARGMLLGLCALLSACVTTQPRIWATESGQSAAEAPALNSYQAADGLSPQGTTRVRLRKDNYPRGFEILQIVRREQAGRLIAGQAVLTAGVMAVTRGGFINGFAMGQLEGEPIAELAGQSWASHPAMQELPQALSEVATRIYAARAWRELERSRVETGWSREDIEAAAQLPAEADAPLAPGYWRLVYENLTGDDDLFRLQFSASLGLAGPGYGVPPVPAQCVYVSEPVRWPDWRANEWQRLRDERVKALDGCMLVFMKTRADLW